MPTIDHAGPFYVRARSHKPGTTAAIRFPVKASRVSTAERFANKMVLELLPGWEYGRVVLSRRERSVKTWILRR